MADEKITTTEETTETEETTVTREPVLEPEPEEPKESSVDVKVSTGPRTAGS